MSQHRKRGGKMKSASHPNGSLHLVHLTGPLHEAMITAYNEDGSFQARLLGDIRSERYVQRTVLVREEK